MALIVKYEFVNHGMEHEQYFQGCGTAFTPYDEVYTGAGSNPYEAAEDALEQLASTGGLVWHEVIKSEMESDMKQFLAPYDKIDEDAEDVYYYVSIRIGWVS